jgi:hypothetical protein
MSSTLTRVLLVTDHVEPTPELLDALCRRTARGPVEVRIVVPNPSVAEWHPLHPERHAKAAETLHKLAETVPVIEASCGVIAEGFVALAHDPMEAIEQSLKEARFDEIILAIAPHGLSRRLHLDLPHRLAHLHVPVTEVPERARTAMVG